MRRRVPSPYVLALALMPAVADPRAAEISGDALAAVLERLRRIEERLHIAPADPADADPRNLDQRLRILERRLELQQEEATARAASTPVVAIAERGLSVRSAKGDFEVRLRGGLQLDHRAFLDDAGSGNDSFVFRRIRPSLEGQLGPLVAYRIVPELAEDTASLIDATIDLKFNPRASLRVGRMKGPVGLERLVSWNALPMIERSFPTELAPNREVGAQLFGESSGGRLNYAVGVFNGAPDGRNGSASDPDDNLEIEARVFGEPWRHTAGALSGLGFGIAGTSGEKDGAGNAFLPRYRTPGQEVFFQYRPQVAARGDHARWSPQAYYYRNQFGLIAEYIESEQALTLPGASDAPEKLKSTAWQLTGSWVLTGEEASYRGIARPSRPFVAGGDGWGALELVGRWGGLAVDDAAFPRYADPTVAASRARAWGLGLNWLLTANLKVSANYTHTQFEDGAEGGRDRADERALFTRVQVSF